MVILWLVILVDFFLLNTFLWLDILKSCHLKMTTINSSEFTSFGQNRDELPLQCHSWFSSWKYDANWWICNENSI